MLSRLGKVMETSLIVLCFCIRLLAAGSSGLEVTKVVVPEGSDAVLNCFLTPETDLRSQTFDWKRDDEEVFFYDQGKHYNNGLSGQDPQFKGRVSHFNDQLEHGNASILIKNTQVNDSGTYSCFFPHLKEEEVYIQLVVQPAFRDRSGERPDAVSMVHTEILNATDAGVPLRCEVQGAFPKPNVTWEDDGGNPVPASEPRISSRGGRYDVSITAHVTKTATNNFCCVVRQEEILHEFKKKLDVPDKMFQVCEDDSSLKNIISIHIGWLIVILIGGLLVGVFGTLGVMWIKTRCQPDPEAGNHNYAPANTAPPTDGDRENEYIPNGHLPPSGDIKLQVINGK